MILGTYPCCDGDLGFRLPDRTPVFVPEDCPHCGTKVWHKLSRLDPETWLEDAFHEDFIVDTDAKTIEPRNPPKPLTDEQKELLKLACDAAWKSTYKSQVASLARIVGLPEAKPFEIEKPNNPWMSGGLQSAMQSFERWQDSKKR